MAFLYGVRILVVGYFVCHTEAARGDWKCAVSRLITEPATQ